jgi:peptidoglycan/LPS O-acetylase OafA/YrhL
LAVAAVLAFHGGVAALPGGFLGVDAFFVLSGFLITTLLLPNTPGPAGSTWPRSGHGGPGGCCRRCCPAHDGAWCSRWLLPPDELVRYAPTRWPPSRYVANWRLMDRGGYFAQTAPPSPLQHTWSLAIEEQFYLVWPVLLLVVLAACRRFGDRRRRAVVAVLCLGGAAESAIAAAVLSGADRLYYGTDTRAAACSSAARWPRYWPAGSPQQGGGTRCSGRSRSPEPR